MVGSSVVLVSSSVPTSDKAILVTTVGNGLAAVRILTVS